MNSIRYTQWLVPSLKRHLKIMIYKDINMTTVRDLQQTEKQGSSGWSTEAFTKALLGKRRPRRICDHIWPPKWEEPLTSWINGLSGFQMRYFHDGRGVDSAKYLPFNKYSFGFKDLIRLNTIREPLLILCCCCYWFNYWFLNQKLQTVGLTKSQGLGMQKQIQGTDELQMWTGFTEFNRLSRVCQVTEAFLFVGCAWAQLFLCICCLV